MGYPSALRLAARASASREPRVPLIDGGPRDHRQLPTGSINGIHVFSPRQPAAAPQRRHHVRIDPLASKNRDPCPIPRGSSAPEGEQRTPRISSGGPRPVSRAESVENRLLCCKTSAKVLPLTAPRHPRAWITGLLCSAVTVGDLRYAIRNVRESTNDPLARS